MKKITYLSALLAFCALLLPLMAEAQMNLPVSDARVVGVEGRGAMIQRGSQMLTVTTGFMITEGDILTTSGATVMLVFKNGSTLRVDPGTQLAMTTVRQAPIPSSVRGSYGQLEANPSESVTVLTLRQGRLSGNVKKLRAVAPRSRFEIASKVGVAGIRGTTFSISLFRIGGVWNYSLRNAVGEIVFQSALNAPNAVVEVPGSGEEVPVEPGEEIVVTGTYDEGTGIFTVEADGFEQVALSSEAEAEIVAAVEETEEAAQDGQGDEQGEAPTPQPEGETESIIVPEDADVPSGTGSEG